MGGDTDMPTYNQVCSGTTNHAEVVDLYFNTEKVSYTTLLNLFWKNHNPTTLNRQGNDIGTQYRSSIFTSNLKEIKIINDYITELNQSNNYSSPVVTTIEMENIFYMAEDYHQNYFEMNQNAPYCSMVIKPKLNKFLKKNKSILKEN